MAVRLQLLNPRMVCFKSKTYSLHRKSKLRNVWGQQKHFYNVEIDYTTAAGMTVAVFSLCIAMHAMHAMHGDMPKLREVQAT